MSEDFWEEWNGKGPVDTGPITPGQYLVKLDSCSLKFMADGTPRTEMVLILCPDQPHAGRYIWHSWPHKIVDGRATFGWLAKMAWTACGMDQRPQGDTVQEVLTTIAKVIGEKSGATMKVTTENRQYKGEDKVRVKNLQRLEQSAPAQGGQGGQDNPYGGQGPQQYGGPQW